MNKKILSITTAVVLTLGITSLAYANSDFYSIKKIKNQPQESSATKLSVINNDSRRGKYNDMLDLMRENGFKEIANDMENGNYQSMDEFMKTMTDDEYQKMIDIMREVNPRMGYMMESFDKDDMLEMHNSCHETRR